MPIYSSGLEDGSAVIGEFGASEDASMAQEGSIVVEEDGSFSNGSSTNALLESLAASNEWSVVD